MTFWLQRGESRFLDLITTSVHGLVTENVKKRNPDKYTLFTAGSKVHSLFSSTHPAILESQIKSFASVAQGRYIREFAYALVALNFCDDTFASNISNIKIKDISDFKYKDYSEFIQSGKSEYLANKSAFDFCKLEFATDEWANFLASKILSYGYFCRYLDVIKLLSEKSKKYLNNEVIFITQLKNLIGPFDNRVSGSGPDFIQETFKSWAFFLDILDLDTGGNLSRYTKNQKLEYLRNHSGYLSNGNKAYEILRNLKKVKFVVKKMPPETIRIMSFMRLVNLEIWRRKFDLALYSALRRVRLLFYLNSNKRTNISDLLKDEKLNKIIKYFKKDFNLAEDLLCLECMGYKLETIENENKFSSFTDYIFEKIISKKGVSFFNELRNVTTKSVFYKNAIPIFKNIKFSDLEIKPIRKFDIGIFNKYCPQGEWIKWIQKN